MPASCSLDALHLLRRQLSAPCSSPPGWQWTQHTGQAPAAAHRSPPWSSLQAGVNQGTSARLTGMAHTADWARALRLVLSRPCPHPLPGRHAPSLKIPGEPLLQQGAAGQECSGAGSAWTARHKGGTCMSQPRLTTPAHLDAPGGGGDAAGTGTVGGAGAGDWLGPGGAGSGMGPSLVALML